MGVGMRIDESESDFIARVTEKFTMEDIAKELFHTNQELLQELAHEDCVDKFTHKAIIERFNLRIAELEIDLSNKLYCFEQTKNKEYRDYFFAHLEGLMHSLDLKSGIRGTLNELITKYKRKNSQSDPEDLLSDLFNTFGYLNK